MKKTSVWAQIWLVVISACQPNDFPSELNHLVLENHVDAPLGGSSAFFRAISHFGALDEYSDYGFIWQSQGLATNLTYRASLMPEGATYIPEAWSLRVNGDWYEGERYTMQGYAVTNEGTMIIGPEVSFTGPENQAPQVNSVSPTQAGGRDRVIMEIENLSYIQERNVFLLEDFVCEYRFLGNNQVELVIPQSNRFGRVSFSVRVGEETYQDIAPFEYKRPTLSEASATEIARGDTLTLLGSYLDYPAGIDTIAYPEVMPTVTLGYEGINQQLTAIEAKSEFVKVVIPESMNEALLEVPLQVFVRIVRHTAFLPQTITIVSE